ncbi:hypothetical protein OAP65_01800 [Litorivicinus sp.]|nr:hypothetical protein [Litorivicinus sp.]
MGPTEFTSLLLENTLIVAHDAGAASLIVNNMDIRNLSGLTAIAEGPALKILRPKITVFGRDQLEKLLPNSSQVLLATGWQSDLIGIALEAAKTKKIKTIGLIDRNKNLELRFRYQNKLLTPDLIIAPSQTTLTLPTSLNHTPVIYLDDLGFQRLVDELKKLNNSVKKVYDFLFIGQPIIDANGSVDFQSQFVALRTLCRDSGKDKCIGFRPHPSQQSNLNEYLPEGIQICDSEESVTLQMAKAKSVVGFDSILLDVAETAKIHCIREDHEAHSYVS